MEIRKDSISTVKLCRFCLSKDSQDLRSLYDRSGGKPRNSVPLTMKILSSMGIEVFPSDKMPSFICTRCSYFMDVCYEYKQICRQADESILHYVQTGACMKPINWPKSLLNTHQSMVVKTEDGATVEVCPQDMSDDDDGEDDENVYKVKTSAIVKSLMSYHREYLKIGDGQEETRIKVITNDETKKTKKGHDAKLRRSWWSCDECERSFTLQQLLELHNMQKHRERVFSCNHCSLKSTKISRTCIGQNQSANSASCQPRPWKLTLIKVTESEPHSHAIKSFNSSTKLAKHVRAHAGEKPYPCKYCDKSFNKSHHHTRHVRMKHAENMRAEFRCEQCGETFMCQDDLMYHSAIHATQDLTCPLCHEQFQNVDGVTTHIKSHVSGMEFTCDYCELVFTSKHKLDTHLVKAHEDELQNEHSQDESSMEMEQDEDDDDGINVKEEDDHMVVEIKKPGSFILSDSTSQIGYNADPENTCSEESETDITYADTSAMETTLCMPLLPAPPALVKASPVAKPATDVASVKATTGETKTAAILRKAEEVKRKFQGTAKAAVTSIAAHKEEKPVAKVEPTTVNSGGNDKSLKLLEKELQELQRTNTPAAKTSAKAPEPVRNTRRPPISSSTPKLRSTNEKKPVATPKAAVEKKVPERRAIKENKQPKETNTPVSAKEKEEKDKPLLGFSVKEDKEKDTKDKPLLGFSVKEDKEKDTKDKDAPTPKGAVKNGASENSDESVRRSSRPSKVKDYAKMAQEKSKDNSDDDSDDAADEEYADESRPKGRRVSAVKLTPKPAAAVKLTPKKRGRPRKDQSAEVPSKVSKSNEEVQPEAKNNAMKQEEESKVEKEDVQSSKLQQTSDKTPPNTQENANSSEQANSDQKVPDVLKSPMGQTLKKVPVKSLPPGVKAMPLPTGVRAMSSGSISEMQIGKKMVKVQTIVMTKADVEAMAKKGLLEMKDGTMVLKQGIKLPTSATDPNTLKSLVGEDKTPESSTKEISAPTRCDLDEEN